MATNINDSKNVYICGPWYGENTYDRFKEFIHLSRMIRDRGFHPLFPPGLHSGRMAAARRVHEARDGKSPQVPVHLPYARLAGEQRRGGRVFNGEVYGTPSAMRWGGVPRGARRVLPA